MAKNIYGAEYRSHRLATALLWLVHTADTDKTRLSRLVGIGGVN